MIERGVKMKVVILITLFILNLAAANRDEFERGFDPRNDVERPIFPFEAFNMGFENFLRKIHPPLLAAMNRYDTSDELEMDAPSVPSSSSERGSKEDKSRLPQTVESKDTATSTSTSTSTSRSESEDSMSRSLLEALDRDSLSTDLSELSVPDRQSPMGVRADRPIGESRSRHDSLEFVDKPEQARSGDGTAEEEAAGSAEPAAESSGASGELGSLAAGSGEPSLTSRRPEGSGTVELSESESFSVGSGVASSAESFLGEARSSRDYLRDLETELEDVPIEEACYNEALVAGLGDFEGEGFEDEMQPEGASEPQGDVRKWEKVRQELSVTNVRKRLQEALSHLEDIKKRSFRRGDNVLEDLNHVISDLEFLCETICQEVPQDYLISASESF